MTRFCLGILLFLSSFLSAATQVDSTVQPDSAISPIVKTSQLINDLNTTTQLIQNSGKDLAPEPASAISVAGDDKVSVGRKYMAVTANPHATRAAQKILEQGGTAIDAAVAAQMVLGLVEPQSSGLGGGGFLLYWDAKSRQLETYDGRETAPITADESLFLNPENGIPVGFFDAVIGGRSVGVAGLVKMLDSAHSAHGHLEWQELFADAIELATNGFHVSERLHTLIKRVPKVKERPEIANYLFDSEGLPLEIGAILKNDQYAATLSSLADNGGEIFYRGDFSRAMIEAVNDDSNPGGLSQADFDRYQVINRPAVCKELFDHLICGMGPPSSGGSTVLAILGILQGFDVEQTTNGQRKNIKLANNGVNDIDVAHRFIEASRLAFADRNTYIADPDFIEVPIERMLDQAYLVRRSHLIKSEQAMAQAFPGVFPGREISQRWMQNSPEMESTTHMSIVDQYGSMLSMTTSIETAFGSRLMTGGFILNNQLTDFSFVPESKDKIKIANRVQGGKRPRSSMSPMIVFDGAGDPVLAIGSPGGKKIIGYVARVLYEVLALDRPLVQSVQAKHVFHIGSRLEVEKGVSEKLLEGLREKKHNPQVKPQTSGIHAVIKQGDHWLGVADPRREGIALGN